MKAFFGIVLILTVASLQSLASIKNHLQQGGNYFTTTSLNVRDGQNNVVGKLQTNDEVAILNLLDDSTEFVQISIIKSNSADNSLAPTLFVSSKYLAASPKVVIPAGQASRYFVVVNIATERTRIYERCTSSPGCGHRMIFETPVLVGLPKDDASKEDKFRLRTQVGTFRISSWKKFYMDSAQKYAPWWSPNFPKLPRVGASIFDWYHSRILPKNSNYEARGAFGWYAAHLTPSPDGQWLHGTFGWGADKGKFIDKYIEDSAGAYLNMSSGCVRHENRAIAYMRHILPEGTEIYRVYAREALRDEKLSRYANQQAKPIWNWILTNEGVNAEGPTSDASSVMSRGVLAGNILEKGSFEINQYPKGIGLWGGTSEKNRTKFTNGNVYGIKEGEFKGVFLVDEGQFVDYAHPRTELITVHSSNAIPSDLKTSSSYTMAKPFRRAQ